MRIINGSLLVLTAVLSPAIAQHTDPALCRPAWDRTIPLAVSTVYFGPALTGDFNGDGDTDLIVEADGASSSNILALLSDGSGGWAEVPVVIPPGISIEHGIVADFEGDGLDDIALPPAGLRNEGQIPLGVGPLTLSEVSRESLGNDAAPSSDTLTCDDVYDQCPDCDQLLYGESGAIVNGDFDGDGLLDQARLITERPFDNCEITEALSHLHIAWNMGQGRFEHLLLPYPLPGTGFRPQPGPDFQSAGVTKLAPVRTKDGKDLLGISYWWQQVGFDETHPCGFEDRAQFKIIEFEPSPDGTTLHPDTIGQYGSLHAGWPAIFGDYDSDGNVEAYFVDEIPICQAGPWGERLVEFNPDGSSTTKFRRSFPDEFIWWIQLGGMRAIDLDLDGLNEIVNGLEISWGGAHDLRPVPTATRWTFDDLDIGGVLFQYYLVIDDLDGDGAADFIGNGEDGTVYLVLSNADPTDIDADGTPDRCEPDVNGNGIPDDHEVDLGLLSDLNGNGQADIADIYYGIEIDGLPAIDVNQNTVPDRVEIAGIPALDQDGDDFLDHAKPRFELVEVLDNSVLWYDVDSTGTAVGLQWQTNAPAVWNANEGLRVFSPTEMGLPPGFQINQQIHIFLDQTLLFCEFGEPGRDRLYTWHPDRGLSTIEWDQPYSGQTPAPLSRIVCSVSESGLFAAGAGNQIAQHYEVFVADASIGLTKRIELGSNYEPEVGTDPFPRVNGQSIGVGHGRRSNAPLRGSRLLYTIDPSTDRAPLLSAYDVDYSTGASYIQPIATPIASDLLDLAVDWIAFEFQLQRRRIGQGVIDSGVNPGTGNPNDYAGVGPFNFNIATSGEIAISLYNELVYLPSMMRLTQSYKLSDLLSQQDQATIYPLGQSFPILSDSGEYMLIGRGVQTSLVRRVFNTNPAPLDLNADGVVDLPDLQLALAAPTDLNGDGSADTEDARALAQWLVWNKPDLATDCNTDGEPDLLQLVVFGGPLADNDGDLVPDACQPCSPIDYTEPFGLLDLADIVAFITAFSANDLAADLAEPIGLLDLADVLAFAQAFQAGCP